MHLVLADPSWQTLSCARAISSLIRPRFTRGGAKVRWIGCEPASRALGPCTVAADSPQGLPKEMDLRSSPGHSRPLHGDGVIN